MDAVCCQSTDTSMTIAFEFHIVSADSPFSRARCLYHAGTNTNNNRRGYSELLDTQDSALVSAPVHCLTLCCCISSLLFSTQLKQLFSAYGLVTESKILVDRMSNKHKGEC